MTSVMDNKSIDPKFTQTEIHPTQNKATRNIAWLETWPNPYANQMTYLPSLRITCRAYLISLFLGGGCWHNWKQNKAGWRQIIVGLLLWQLV